MNLKYIILNERSQFEENMYMGGAGRHYDSNYILEKSKTRESKQIGGKMWQNSLIEMCWNNLTQKQ